MAAMQTESWTFRYTVRSEASTAMARVGHVTMTRRRMPSVQTGVRICAFTACPTIRNVVRRRFPIGGNFGKFKLFN